MIERDAFFRPGGTLPPGTASYVPRRADKDIVEALVSGEYVFVLDSRQKGKSSLIVHATSRLHAAGVTTVRIDLQRIGCNLTPEQWYAGLLRSLGQELGLGGPLFDHWRRNIEVGPATRFFGALEEVALVAISSPIVIFVDEVDFVRSLPFSSDELFAAIRDCYNRRSHQPEYGRLTFCLVGVAAPSQLIENDDVTPFNIGRRVELTDFTRDELEPYAERLSGAGRDGRRLLDRIHYWVSGHPYLSQLLAAKVSTDPSARDSAAVDAIVRRSLLAEEVRHKEPNLADVERRLLEASLPDASQDESRSRVLEVYGELLRRGLSPGRHDAVLVATLLLSGVAIEIDGTIRIRSRLYRTLFDERWRRENLPDAEARRQRAAAKRAAWRVGTLATMLLAVFASLSIWLVALAGERDAALSEARALSDGNARLAYNSSVALAAEQLADGNYLGVVRLVDSQTGYRDHGWEWRYLASLVRSPRVLTVGSLAPGERIDSMWEEGGELVLCLSDRLQVMGRAPDPRLVFGPMGARARNWLRETSGQAPLSERVRAIKESEATGLAPFLPPRAGQLGVRAVRQGSGFEVLDSSGVVIERIATASPPRLLALSPTGRFVTSVSDNDGRRDNFSVYDRITRRRHSFIDAQFSPDDRWMISEFDSGRDLEVLNPDGTLHRLLHGHMGAATSSGWFSDGRHILTSGYDGTLRIWDAQSGRQTRLLLGSRAPLASAAITDGERSVAALTTDGILLQWDLAARSKPDAVKVSEKEILWGRLSPRGDRFVTAGTDGLARVLNLSGQVESTIRIGFEVGPKPVGFLPDGRTVVFVTAEGALLFADALSGKRLREVSFDGPKAVWIDAKAGKIAVALDDQGLAVLDGAQGKPRRRVFPGMRCIRVALSPDGARLAVADTDGVIRCLDAVTLAETAPPADMGRLSRHLEWSHDGRWLVATSASKDVVLLRSDLSDSRRLDGHASRAWNARFDANDRRLLTCSFDGTVRIWDVRTGQPAAILQHPGWVPTAEWSPDGTRIVTTCADGNVRVFSPDGTELIKLQGHKGYVFDAEFTPDGSTIVSTGSDGTVRYWRTPSDAPSAPSASR